MVFPLLLAAAGSGMQAYGAHQKTAAQERAQTTYDEWLRRFNGVGDVADQQMQQQMGQIGDQYQGAQQSLADSFNPTDRIGSFQQGSDQSTAHLQQVLSLMQSMKPHQTLPQGGEPGVFSQTAGREQATNDAAAGRLEGVVAQGAGLEAMHNRDAENVFGFGNTASNLNRGIANAQRLYALGQALRERSLARASLQRDADLSKASMAGNGWMYAGGLTSAVGQGMGSAQANAGTGASADPSYQSQLNDAAPGGSAYNPGFSQYQGPH